MALSSGAFALTRIHSMPSTTLLAEERGFDLGPPRETHGRHPSTAAPGGGTLGAANLVTEQSTPPGLRCPLRRVAGAGWWTSEGSTRPSVLLPEVERAGLVLGLVTGLATGLVFGVVLGLVLRLVVGLVVVLGHFRQGVAAERGAHDGPHGFASHHHRRAGGHRGSPSGVRIAPRAMP